MHLRIINQTREQLLASRVRKADNLFMRLRGLLFRPPLEADQGMLLTPCNAVHCIGMTYPIDVIFIDKNLAVVGLSENLRPYQFSPMFPRAHHCLELPAGVISKTGTQVDDRLVVEEVC